MTVFLRDMSHYDGDESLAGFVGTTHKATEGTSYVDAAYAARLNHYHAQGVKVLGSYHVLHTGALAAQLDHWLSTMDALTPWWRTFPGFILQVDAERWPSDNVSPDTVKAFARLLVDSGCPGFKVTYASRGQYGDSLTGIATPLWNAAYHSATYPGDGAADWAPYSGRAPVFWQYTSTPFDKNAYRGSLDELLALLGGDDMAALQNDDPSYLDLIYGVKALLLGENPTGGPSAARRPNAVQPLLEQIETKVGALTAPQVSQDQLDASVAKVMSDPAWLDALAAKLAGHIHVS
jgi:hypothetical protein